MGQLVFVMGRLISDNAPSPVTFAFGSPVGLSAQKTYISGGSPDTTVLDAVSDWYCEVLLLLVRTGLETRGELRLYVS